MPPCDGAVCDVLRRENSRDAEREQARAHDERRRVGALGHLRGVLVLLELGLVLLLPHDFPAGEIDRRDDFFGISAAVHERAAVGRDRRRIPFTDFYGPSAFDSRRPLFRNHRSGDDAIARGTAPLAPVLGQCNRRARQEGTEKQYAHARMLAYDAAPASAPVPVFTSLTKT